MSNVRRWYIYIVCAVSLQAVAWAIIALLRNLFVFGVDPLAVAFQIAVVVIGLPVFLAHWLWGQRLVERAVEEGGAALRRLYLYGSMAAFLGPWTANAFDLIRRLLGGINQLQSSPYRSLSVGEAAIYHLVALIVLAALWFYHYRVAADDSKAVPETGGSATLRRLYVLGFSAAGLIMTTLAIINLARWLMLGFGGSVIRVGGLGGGLTNEIARLAVGVPLWVIFWRWSQRLFDGPSEEERGSTLRKFYLYAAVFIGALTAVASATGILAGLLRRVLALAPEGDVRQPISVVIGMAMVWAFHAFVLRDDAQRAGEAPRQAGLHRLYLYLIATVGLSALLVGVSGDVSVVLRALDKSFGEGLRGEAAWFTSAIIAGLPVWIIPWRQSQAVAGAAGPAGADARRSVVRKIYLYFFLFLGTMTVLSSAVYIVYRVLGMILGGEAPTLTQLGHALSFGLIAVAVWLYHGGALLGDGRLAKREQAALLSALRVVVVDVGDGHFGKAVTDHLKREFPDISLDPILLAPGSNGKAGKVAAERAITARLKEAGLIVGPWVIAAAGGVVSDNVAAAVVSSPARKLLIPIHAQDWDWAGVDRWDSDAIVLQTV
ncbi:MAG TPA: DUF5671 domain-containing protein, partial [Anaerolineales bacterium]|nr:DUF5671 domain-containing protein [Anaerolineales bacterium]